MFASYTILLAADVPNDYHSSCWSDRLKSPHKWLQSISWNTLSSGSMWHTGWANETCLDKASMQSLRLHFGKSLKTVAEASTTEAANEIQCLVDYCSKLAAELT